MLQDLLLMQKREVESRLAEPYVVRDVGNRSYDHDLVNVVMGPRRAGKSFFAVHLAKTLGNFGYVNFDDERLVREKDYDALVAAADAIYGNPRHLLLDEIQNLPGWELLVNRLQRQGRRLLITGSNAHLLSSDLATHLTGRHMQTVLFPFSFPEFLRAGREPATAPEKLESLRSYAESGGYPEPLLKGVGRADYLNTLLRSVLYKDIVVRHKIRSPQALDDLAAYLVSSVARDYSLTRLTTLPGLSSVHTAEKYLKHLEEALLFFSVSRFSRKVREQIRANKKIYCVDNGVVTSAAFRTSLDRGRLYENLVAIHLQRRRLDGGLEFFFWKGPRNEEVDFVVKSGPQIVSLIQVTSDMSEPATREREVRALLKAGQELECPNLLILSESDEREEDASWFAAEGRIKYVPLWKWLSEAADSQFGRG
ncbi:MAG: ATP-binding protein [Deltaproteobacteria bacterium]|nr:ATP-binding protein [Deltaproteobacteria bacterium]